METYYLYIIELRQYVELYKTGTIKLDPPIDVKWHDDKPDLPEKQIEDLQDIFADLDWAGNNEWLLIRVAMTNDNPRFVQIQNLVEIIPLTEESKRSLERKYLETKFSKPWPVFKKILPPSIGEKPYIKSIKGIYELFEIKNETNGFRAIPNDFGDIFNRRGRQETANDEMDLLTNTILYERYEYWSDKPVGYLIDLAYILSGLDMEKLKRSSLYKEIGSNITELERLDISESIIGFSFFNENWGKLGDFTKEKLKEKNIDSSYVDLEFKVITPLFLYCKDKIRSSENSFSKSEVYNDLSKIFPYFSDEVLFTIQLIGGFMGYKNLCDDIYSIEGRYPFWKGEKRSPYILDKTNESVDKEYLKTIFSQLKPVETSGQEPKGKKKATGQEELTWSGSDNTGKKGGANEPSENLSNTDKDYDKIYSQIEDRLGELDKTISSKIKDIMMVLYEDEDANRLLNLTDENLMYLKNKIKDRVKFIGVSKAEKIIGVVKKVIRETGVN